MVHLSPGGERGEEVCYWRWHLGIRVQGFPER